MFIKIPVAISIRYGMPIQILMMMTMTRASTGLLPPRKSIACAGSMMPRSIRKPLIRPFRLNILEMYNREMNCGIAIVMMRIVLQTFFKWMPFLLIAIATRMPRK